MITCSFVFLERVSRKKERSFWQQGIKDWPAFLKASKIRGISNLKKAYYSRKIQEAQRAVYDNRADYFVGRLPAQEMWRLYPRFKDECCFLDIETNGSGQVIVLGISNYYTTKTYVKGINLDCQAIEQELQKFKMAVTFNGSSFDLPKLKKLGITILLPHIDLKPLCVNVGLTGGLKEIERVLHLRRPAHLYGHPIDLWKAFHASGDREYLDLLIDYNKEDCENLKGVMDWIYPRLRTSLYEGLSF